MRILGILLILFSFALDTRAGTGAIPQGSNILLLKDNLKFKNTDTKILTNDSDSPTAVAKSADEGSLYIQNGTGYIFRKTDAGSSVNWSPMLGGAAGLGTDNCVVRWDGTAVPLLQSSVFCITDLGVGTGLTSLTVASLTMATDTISSTGDITLLPTTLISLPTMTASAPLFVNATNDLASLPLTNGQLIVGSTGANPVAASLTGTANRVSVTNGAGTITLSAPQDIHTGASPTFSGVTLSGLTAGSIPFAGVGGLISQDNTNLFWDDTSNFLGILDNTPSFPLDVNGAVRFTGNINSNITAQRAVITDASGILTASTTTSTEISYVNGVTSAIQTQLDGKLGTGLGDGRIWVGDATNTAQPLIPSGDVTITNAGVTAISAGVIVNNDVSATANIAISKLLAPTNGSVIYSDASGNLKSEAAFTYDETTNALGVATGQFNIDNLRMDGNVISSTDVNGNVTITPNGTGQLVSTNSADFDSSVNMDSTLTVDSDVILNSATALIRNSTLVDSVTINGGNAAGSANGAQINLYGISNVGNAGDLLLGAGAGAGEVQFRTNAANRGEISQTGAWTVGTSGGTETHVINGNVNGSGSGNFANVISRGNLIGSGSGQLSGKVSILTQNTLELQDTAGGEFVALRANGTTTSYTLTMPPAQGAATQVLKNDGSGNLSWEDSAGTALAPPIKYQASATNTISNNTLTFIDFGTKVSNFDPDDDVLGEGGGNVTSQGTGWRYPCQNTGYHDVFASISFNGGAWTDAEQIRLKIYVNGAETDESQSEVSGVAAGDEDTHRGISSTVYCASGQLIEIAVLQTSGANLSNRTGTASYVAIKQIPTSLVAQSGHTQYNLTVSGTGWTTTRAVGVPYQTSGGDWRFKFNIRGTRTTGSSIASYTITITGVTFKNVTDFYQAVSVTSSNLANDRDIGYAFANPNAATITAAFASNDPSSFSFSGDVELNGVPSL